MPRTVFEATAVLYDKDVDIEDGGAAMIGHVENDEDEEFFVRLQSWSLSRNHKTMHDIIGKKIRITVEVLD